MSKMKRKKLSLAVRNALNAGVVVGLVAPFAHGQQAPKDSSVESPAQVAQQPAVPPGTPPMQAVPQRIERVEVTGSRIPLTPNLTSVSPITQITSGDIQIQGLTSTEEIVSRLPQAYADFGSNVSNGTVGTNTINLRNLGASRTLVLIDGKRMPAGSPLYWATDVTNI